MHTGSSVRTLRFLAFALAGTAAGCGDQIEAVKTVAQMAKSAADQAERAKKAEEARAGGQQGGAGEGTTPPSGDAITDPAAALPMAAQVLQQQGAMREGPVVNWRQLIGFLPDQFGGFTATGDAKGSTQKIAPVPGAGGTEVKRNYRRGDESARITIVDTMLSPAVLNTFRLTAGIEEDSSDGYSKSATIGGHPARIEWKKGSKRSTATVLVGGRYIVTVRVRNATSGDAAKQLAGALDLAGIAAVEPEPS